MSWLTLYLQIQKLNSELVPYPSTWKQDTFIKRFWMVTSNVIHPSKILFLDSQFIWQMLNSCMVTNTLVSRSWPFSINILLSSLKRIFEERILSAVSQVQYRIWWRHRLSWNLQWRAFYSLPPIHQVVLYGTSCPTHYQVLIDENQFTLDSLHILT